MTPCCFSSGSAIPAHATPATATTSASWRSRRSPSATASRRGGGASQGVAAEGALGGERVLLLLPGTFMNESGRAVAEAAHFYKLGAGRHRRVPRRARTAARQGAGEDRRRQCRPQRPALDHRAYRQRLSPRAHRHRPSRRQGPGAGYVLQDFAKSERPWVEALCDIVADNAGAAGQGQGFDVSRTRCISPWPPRASARTRSRKTRE